MIVVSGVAGALVGPLPWPVATLPGFVQLDAAEDDWLHGHVESAMADAGRHADDLAWRSVGVYRAGDGNEACRLAQRWDWCGPAFGVDAECAGGLVALLLAAQELEAGHCDLAVVVAEHVVAGASDWDQSCAPLAAEAREGGPRAGAAVLVLERAADARRVRAKVSGGAHRRLGVPSGMVGMSLRGIADLLRQGLGRAKLAPSDVGYCELHALGTPIGDAVELAAFGRVWSEGKPSDRPSRLGSHKAAFGQLEAAAGLVGVARVLGWFESGTLPPTTWHRPFSKLTPLPAALALEEGGPETIRAGGCLALSRSGVGAVVLLEPLRD